MYLRALQSRFHNRGWGLIVRKGEKLSDNWRLCEHRPDVRVLLRVLRHEDQACIVRPILTRYREREQIVRRVVVLTGCNQAERFSATSTRIEVAYLRGKY